MSEVDYASLVTAADNPPHAPVIVIWENLNTHVSAAMQGFIDAPGWPTVIRLPACAPGLTPTEGAWPDMKNGLGNLGAGTLAAIAKNRLESIQHRPQLIDAFGTQTGLTLERP